MATVEEQIQEIHTKDELIKWLVNEYKYLSDKAYKDVHEDVRKKEMQIIKCKADELMGISKGLKAELQKRTKTKKEITQKQIEDIKEYLINEMIKAADKGMSYIKIKEIYLLIIKCHSKELIDAAIEWLNIEGIKAYIYTERDRSTAMVGHKPQNFLYISWEED